MRLIQAAIGVHNLRGSTHVKERPNLRIASESFASVCSFVLCDSSTFLKFWLDDTCRDCFLSHVELTDLASLRLTCHDFSVRAAPALFDDLSITFKASTFTKPARLAALDRLGFYVKSLKFNLPHSSSTVLPPLVDPKSGSELSFSYTPHLQTSTAACPKYGDLGTTEILTRQWPALFHAATNVPAFVRAFSSFINLASLTVSCPGYNHPQTGRPSTVDFALISLRIAIEQNNLNALESLTLSPMHPEGFLYLSCLPGYGATPRSARRWSRIKHLAIHADAPTFPRPGDQPDHFKLLQTYIRNFQSNVETFDFRWNGAKGSIPVRRPVRISSEETTAEAKQREAPHLRFPKLRTADFENVKATARDISSFASAHRRTLEELNLESVELTQGTWEMALAPLTKLDRSRQTVQAQAEAVADADIAEIPIMLSPTVFPLPMQRAATVGDGECQRRGTLRFSRWLSSGSKVRTPTAARKVREGLQGCEEQLKKVFRSSIRPWR